MLWYKSWLETRWRFIIGIVLYTLAAVVVASSGSAAQLIGGRALQGTGAAILMPATMAILHDAFPKEKQGLVLGIWGAVGGVAFAVGPLIGGFFTDAINWRWVWWSNVPVAVIALVLAGPMLRGLSGRKRGVKSAPGDSPLEGLRGGSGVGASPGIAREQLDQVYRKMVRMVREALVASACS